MGRLVPTITRAAPDASTLAASAMVEQNVGYGSVADIASRPRHVRFTPIAHIRQRIEHVCFVPEAHISPQLVIP